MTLEEQVKAMLEALRPMLQQDGGDLEFVKMEGKTVTLKLVGHCGSCPYAMMTLKSGIEQKLRELDPELVVSLVGVGGQGILLTANLLADAAALSGLDVKKSEIHGMAQRGGSVISSVRFGDEVHSPIIPEGQSDVLVAFDRLEGLRWQGFLAKGGKVLMNNVDLVPVTVSSGLQQPVTDFEARLAKAFPDVIMVDAAKIADEVGNARTMNMVIAGALSALVPFEESKWIEAMEQMLTGPKAKLLPVNKEAFARGRKVVLG